MKEEQARIREIISEGKELHDEVHEDLEIFDMERNFVVNVEPVNFGSKPNLENFDVKIHIFLLKS
ncbi:MAG: hypothetical protein ACTSRS_00180 [Candidatus Helarchaeota archaeon]